ncbi:hypothetical protein RJ639_003092 [Escallonia herrerae]|uniref:Uncharacterized protein n=1 Tax=Escallonia herrerae TaxID=1293975 RepID=A0AA88VYA2_9ASTE|nr:hypothetical protein RJ639_003092 [Escallonia herrerae]
MADFLLLVWVFSIQEEDQGTEDMRSPAFLLREDSLLFERVRKVTATHFIKQFNDKGETAE